MDNLIYTRDALPKEFCDFAIKKFEASKSTMEGMSGDGVNKIIKDSTDLMITAQLDDKDWLYIYDYLREDLLHSLVEYKRLHPWLVRGTKGTFSSELSLVRTCQGRFSASHHGGEHAHMQMQRYVDNQGYYAWHYETDGTSESMRHRQMAFMWYLNSPQGGETEFRHQNLKIEPKTGTAVLFPAFWTHVHRGNPPGEGQSKYIITGWIEYVEPENVSLEFAEDFFV